MASISLVISITGSGIAAILKPRGKNNYKKYRNAIQKHSWMNNILRYMIGRESFNKSNPTNLR